MTLPEAKDFSEKGQVKLGEAAVDDIDKGKENGQCWIKNKLNSINAWCIYAHGSVQHKGKSCPSHKQKLARISAIKPSTL